MMNPEYTCETPTATLYYAHPDSAQDWHDGAGYYYVDDEYPEEGSIGAFATEAEAREHATTAWDPPYRITGEVRVIGELVPV